jgi:FkbM family methyltransferase
MSRWVRVLKFRLDLWEVALLLLLVAAALYRPAVHDSGSYTDHEVRAFAQKYGPERHTEGPEEWMIRDFFEDKRDGFFLDVGANHHERFNKTWYLEHNLGWSGIAVDALKEFALGYQQYRPRTKFFAFFVSDRSDETAKVHVISGNTLVASSNREFVSEFGTPDRVDTVPTVALNDLLAAQHVERLDFLTMDIELHEPAALQGFDIERYRPALVCIEALLPVRQQILEYFARHGYIVEGRYLRSDREDLFFKPFDPSQPRP